MLNYQVIVVKIYIKELGYWLDGYDKEKNVIFLGRLATYTYLDMWMAIKQAMLKIAAIA